MRKRFRGNKPVATSVELEAGGSEPQGQLYAGKGSYEGIKGTDGREAPSTTEEE